MKIEIWAEITCPWCGLGSHRLDRAVERFEHGDEVEVVHHSFPLSSSFPVDETFSVRDALLRRHGIGGSQAEASTRRIEALAEAEGLTPYQVLDNLVANTDLAHEFLAHASAEGKNREAWDTIFRAYFGQARPVFSMDDLLDLGQEITLDRESTRQALTEHRYQRQVSDDAARAQRLGATGAPFIVIDGRYGIPGAQDSDGLLRRAAHGLGRLPPAPPRHRRRRCGLRPRRLRRSGPQLTSTGHPRSAPDPPLIVSKGRLPHVLPAAHRRLLARRGIRLPSGRPVLP